MCPTKSDHIISDDIKGEDDKDHRYQDQDTLLTMSLQDIVDSPRAPPSPPPSMSQQPSDNISNPLIDDLSIPISAQMFNFCDEFDIFQDTLQNSEVTSSPNCCNSYEDQNSSYTTTNISFPSSIVHNNNNIDNKNNIKLISTQNIDISNFQLDQNGCNTSTTTSSTTTTATTITAPTHHHNTGLSVIYDPQIELDNDISASIDFSTPQLPYNFNPTTLTNHHIIAPNTGPRPNIGFDPCTIPLPLINRPGIGLGPVFDEDCLSSIPPFLRLNPNAITSTSSCTFLDPNTLNSNSFQHGIMNTRICNDNSGLFDGNLLIPTDFKGKDIDFQADNVGIFCSDQLGHFNSGDIQVFSNENTQLVNGAATSSAPISNEISSLDDSTYKVGKLSVEQRKEKIHRYMKKRNQRNFCKKIKYACRKTLADSRPRVRGRFAKNDEYGEGHKHINGQHDDDDYDEVAVKQEDDMVDSSDIFAHISGVNSFKCNYQLQSWI